MKKFLIPALAVLLGAAILPACSSDDNPVDPDPVIQADMDISGFSKIDVKDGFNVTVNIQGLTDVKVNFSESVRDYVTVMKVDSTLKLEIEGDLSRVNGKTYNAIVGMPNLLEVGLTDKGRLTVNSPNVSGPSFKGDLKQASILNGRIQTFDFELKVDDGSQVVLTGSASTGRLQLDHGGTIDLRDFSFNTADVDAKNGSIVYVNFNPSGLLNVKADGGSKIYHRGNPTLGNIDLKGGSTMEAF